MLRIHFQSVKTILKSNALQAATLPQLADFRPLGRSCRDSCDHGDRISSGAMHGSAKLTICSYLSVKRYLRQVCDFYSAMG